MKSCRLSTLITVAIVSTMAMYGQAFRPLGLHIEKDSQVREDFCPKMHVEENTLFVCTNRGLYSKDLSNNGSEWQLAGFEGIPLQDYARSGNDILALRYNVGVEFLLLSRDGGKTYEDVTPEQFKQSFGGHNVMISLAQHPDDPNTLLVSSYYLGIYQSTDFGKTWRQLTETMVGTFIGYHPKQPEIIYNSGDTDAMEPLINISYDGGETWEGTSPYWEGDNSFCRVAFHPACPDCWISCGWGAIYTSTDNGHTWNTQNFGWEDEYQRNNTYWSQIIYDNKCSDIVYAAGNGETLKLMCSTDGGRSWGKPLSEDSQEWLYDLQQYDDKLLIYINTDVYEVSKTSLIATYPNTKETVNFFKGQVATITLPITPDASKGMYFRLDRVEGNEIIFEQELQPRAHVPYIIVPGEDFSIEVDAMELEGLRCDTASVEGISFIGSFQKEEVESQEGFYIKLIDTTPDCSLSPSGEAGREVYTIGTLRAYLLVHWDDPYHPGGTKVPAEKMEIVLKDNPNSIEIVNSKSSNSKCYDLSGKMVNRKSSNGKFPRGIYIEGGKVKIY